MRVLTPEYLTAAVRENGGIPPNDVMPFQEMIYERYRANPRPMPWRETGDPYRILVSEIMLQQTQVERVRGKYAEFLAAFPTVFDLAAAPLSEVLTRWQGLGYNRRAIHLKRCAEEVVRQYGGEFPRSAALLQQLSGIGPYTARAVAAFAFGVAEPCIETNIRTLYIHFFCHGRERVPDRDLMPLIAATLDQANPREWYYALMDYGVMLKQLYPNPGRRSSHHTRQSRFEGSNRQLRSRLLRAVLAEPGISAEQLSETVRGEREAVCRNLEALVREGFLRVLGHTYEVAHNDNGGNASASPPPSHL